MADDLSDLNAAFAGGAPWAGALPTPVGRAAQAASPEPEDARPLTVTPAPSTAPTHDDMADLHVAFAKGAPAAGPTKSTTVAATDTAKDIAESAGSGLVRGIVGAPFAAASLAKTGADTILNSGEYIVRKILGAPKSYHDIAQATQEADQAQQQQSIIPQPPSVQQVGAAAQQALTPYLHTPQTTPGQYAETAGEFAPLVAASPASLAAMGTLGGAAKTLAGHVVAPAVGSEAAGQVADQYAPDFADVARLGGGIAGGVGAHLVGQAASGIGNVTAPMVAKGLAAAGAPGMQQRLAGQQLIKAASDPTGFRDALNNQPDQLVPGSQPTTFQVTGDTGIGQLERGDRTVNSGAYLDRDQEQNSKRLAALQGIQPDGDPEAVSAHVRSRLQAIDDAAAAKVDAAQQAAQQQAAAIPGTTPELAGQALRDQVNAANDAAKTNERALWQAIDPEGKLANAMGPLQKVRKDTYTNLPKAAVESLTPDEIKFNKIIKSYQPVEPFAEVQSLRSELAGAMRDERVAHGSSPAYRRMTKLMDAVHDAISNVTARHALNEAYDVEQGVLHPDDAMVLRLQKEADEFRAARQAEAGTSAVASAGNGRAGDTARVPESSRKEIQSRGGPSDAARTQSVSRGEPSDRAVQPDATPPQSDVEAAGRVRAASAATKQRKQTFEEGTVGRVTAPGPRSGEFRLPASAVPDTVFARDAKGYDAAKSYLKATGNAPEAIEALQHAATSKLRDIAISGSDSTIKPAGLMTFKRQYGHALRAIDEASPGFSSRFDDAAKATEAVAQATSERTAATKAFQAGIVGKLIGATTPEDVTAKVSAALKADAGLGDMRRLADLVKASPDAQAGLRSAAADWLSKQLITSKEEGTSNQPRIDPNRTRNLIRDLGPKLGTVFNEQEMSNLRAIAADVDRAQRSVTGNKVAGSPGTAQDLLAAGKAHGGHGQATSFLSAVVLGALAGEHLPLPVSEHVKPVLAGALAGGSYMLNALRSAGIRDVRALVHDALLNPERAREYVNRAAPPGTPLDRKMAATVSRSFLTSAAADDRRRAAAPPTERIEPTLDRDPRWNGARDLPHPAHDDRSADGRFANPGDTQDALRGALKRGQDDVLAMMRAYHGSSADFDRFDINKRLSGVGAGTYGFGHSFAESEGFAGRFTTLRDGKGVLYQAALDLDPATETLDFTKPLREQPEVLGKLRAAFPDMRIAAGRDAEDLYDELREEHGGGTRGDRELAKVLPAAGIKGLRYEEAPGQANYTVFRDQDISITHKNGRELTPAERGEVLASMRQGSGDIAARARPTSDGSTLTNLRTGETAPVQSTTPLRDMLARHVVEGTTPPDTLLRAANQSVGGRLSKLVGDMPVHVVDRDAMRTLAQGRVKMQRGFEPGGFYDPRAGHIVVLDEALRDPKEGASLLLHEGLHGALMRTIDASEGMHALIDHLRSTALAQHLERGGEVGDHYGLTDAHEFISEANSNPQFQRFLQSLPADDRLVSALGLDRTSKPTMWSAFVETVRKVFGMAPGTRTYLDAALKATDHLFNKAEADAAQPSTPTQTASRAGLTDRAAALMPALRGKFGETIDAAAAPGVQGFGDAMARSPHMPALLGSALAPRFNANDAGYQRAWAGMEAKGLFSPDEQRLLQREAPRMALAVRRSFPSFDAGAASPAQLRAAAFAHFANGRGEEGMEGSHLHIGIRRAFERIYQALDGVQSVGNRAGFYRPSDVVRGRDEQTIAGLAPNIPGEATRAQHL